MRNTCLCCGRNLETRMGYCFDCVEAESIIVEGVDMYDNEIPQKERMSKGMSKLQHILRRYIQISDDKK